MMIFRWLIVVLFFSFHQSNLFAQCPPLSNGCVRITIYGGGDVEFIFNSINDYNNGITLNNWSLIGIGITEPAANYNGWTVSVSAQDADGDGALNGSIGANTILLSDIQVRATPVGACPSCNFLGSLWVNLVGQPASTVIVNSSSDPACPCPPGILTTLVPATNQINISYRCGVVPAKSMMSRPADFYSDNLYFDIVLF